MGQNQTTHVANNSGYTAYVRVATERSKVISFGGSHSASAGAAGMGLSQSSSMHMTLAWNDFIKEGFERVPPGELAKSVYASTETPFVSVVLFLNEDENEIRLICHNKRAENDGSYIFDHDNIFRSKYGTLWQPQ